MSGSDSQSTHSGGEYERKVRYTDARDDGFIDEHSDPYINAHGDSTDNPDESDAGTCETVTDRNERPTSDGSTSKRRKDRTKNKLDTERLVVRRLDDRGEPLSPEKVAKTYGNDLGCILRETCSINQGNLRARGSMQIRDLLIQKLHGRFSFPKPYDTLDANNLVNNHAISKFSKNLSTWRSNCKKLVDKDFDEVQKKIPSFTKDEWDIFKEGCQSDAARANTEWGKTLRAKNLGNHTLGSRGYLGKRPVWEKQDATLEAMGAPNPWREQFKEPLEHDFIRARYKLDKETGEWRTDPKTKRVEKELHDYYAGAGSSQGSSARWDIPLNRGINVTLDKDPLAKPAGGRVNGVGTGAKWKVHYPENKYERRERRKADRAADFEKMKQDARDAALAELKAQTHVQAAAAVQGLAQQMLPTLFNAFETWVNNGHQGNFVLPQLVVPSNPFPPNVAGVDEENSPAVAHHSSPSVSYVGVRASPTADLDALTEETPCTLLAEVKSEMNNV